jgi:hypothetical protein
VKAERHHDVREIQSGGRRSSRAQREEQAIFISMLVKILINFSFVVND